MKTRITAVAIAIVMIIVAMSAHPAKNALASPHGVPTPTTGITVQNGPQPGEATISWAVVPEATHYRIAYVNLNDYNAFVTAHPNDSWRQTVNFIEIDAVTLRPSNNRVQFTLPRLQPGTTHGFAVLTSTDAHWSIKVFGGTFVWPNPTWQTITTPQAQAGAASPPSTTRPRPQVQTLSTARQLMLNLINRERQNAGVSTLTLGSNHASQLHAEDMSDNCFTNHWGSDGIRPTVRYALDGGTRLTREAIWSTGPCFTPHDDMTLHEAVQAAFTHLLNDPDDYLNMLHPDWRIVNIGVATGRSHAVVQQYEEKEHARFSQLPTIRDGRLSFSGEIASPGNQSSPAIQAIVYRHQTPHDLTSRQLAYYVSPTSDSHRNSRIPETSRVPENGNTPVAILSAHSASTFAQDKVSQVPFVGYEHRTPYRKRPDPALSSREEWAQIQGPSLGAGGSLSPVTIPYIALAAQDVSKDHFTISADISSVLQEHGDGIYTIVIKDMSHFPDDAILAAHPIFHGINPPARYVR